MRKLTFILSLYLVFTLCGCGQNSHISVQTTIPDEETENVEQAEGLSIFEDETINYVEADMVNNEPIIIGDAAPDDYRYTIENDGTACIYKYVGNGGDIIIPSMIEGYTVTRIRSFTFKDFSSLVSVEIPNSITEIYGSSFADCSALSEMTLPEGLTYIAYGLFDNCSWLKSVKIPDRVTRIDTSAFYGCNSLASVKLPQNIVLVHKWNEGMPESTEVIFY